MIFHFWDDILGTKHVLHIRYCQCTIMLFFEYLISESDNSAQLSQPFKFVLQVLSNSSNTDLVLRKDYRDPPLHAHNTWERYYLWLCLP